MTKEYLKRLIDEYRRNPDSGVLSAAERQLILRVMELLPESLPAPKADGGQSKPLSPFIYPH